MSSQRSSNGKKPKPKIIGIYGLPGSGKTTIIEHLKVHLGSRGFAYFEGSDVIRDLIHPGLGGRNAFHTLSEPDKKDLRKRAIREISNQCRAEDKVGIVSGHFMFWDEDEEGGNMVFTQDDAEVYTHIVYVDVVAESIASNRANDKFRERPVISLPHLRKWLEAEKTLLRELCYQHGILFSSWTWPTTTSDFLDMMRDFREHDEGVNLARVEKKLDEIVAGSKKDLDTMLVFDGDKTLAAADTGHLFWGPPSMFNSPEQGMHPLERIFGSDLGYSYAAFRQATVLYEDFIKDDGFEYGCVQGAIRVNIYPEILALLHKAAESNHVGAVVVTCGLRRVWEEVLRREGLSETVKVIGAGQIDNGYVVTPDVKAALVDRLRDVHKQYVFAFGDSPLDLPMLGRADEAIVVVGDAATRSKTMEEALRKQIDEAGLWARQAVMSPPLRLDTGRLPLVDLTHDSFINAVFNQKRIPIFHATNEAATKLLTTPMQNADTSSPELRSAHRRTGWYLSHRFLAAIIGTETHPIPHVQGGEIAGHRLRDENKTLIVALMRGGEPMATGINEALPLAGFLHANTPADITDEYVAGTTTFVLVDSVINSGASIAGFVRHVVGRAAQGARIVVVAGVVQKDFVRKRCAVLGLGCDAAVDVCVVALRLSENKYKGRGGTDTGNRLFNTTHLA